MKVDDFQKFLLSKYEKGEPLTKFFEDLNGFMSSRTIRRWFKRDRYYQCISLFGSSTHYQDERNDPKGEKTNET